MDVEGLWFGRERRGAQRGLCLGIAICVKVVEVKHGVYGAH